VSRGGRQRPLRPLIDNGDGTLTVTLTQGYTAIIDAADADLAAPYNWSARVSTREDRTYAFRRIDGHTTYLHRIVMGLVVGDKREVDHINSDPLDCRRANMRIATRTQNAHHIRSHRNSSSRFVGVSWHAQTSTWRAAIGEKHLGLFVDEVEAARARDAAAIERFGVWAVLNLWTCRRCGHTNPPERVSCERCATAAN